MVNGRSREDPFVLVCWRLRLAQVLLSEDQPRQPFAVRGLDVVGDGLARRQVAQGAAGKAQHGQHAAQAVGLVELGQDQAIDLDHGEPLDGGPQAPLAGDGAQDQVDLVGSRLEQELGQLADLDLVARAAPRGVDEDEVDGAQLVEARGISAGSLTTARGRSMISA